MNKKNYSMTMNLPRELFHQLRNDNRRYIVVAISIGIAVSCVSKPATLESVAQAYNDGNSSYLEQVSGGKMKTKDSSVQSLANRDLVLLKQKQLQNKIETANKAEDMPFFTSLLADKSNIYLTTDLRQKAIGYEKRLELLFAAREAVNRRFALNSAIDAAFDKKDTVYLTGLISPINKVKVESVDPELKKKAAVLLSVIADPEKSRNKFRTGTIDNRVRNIPLSIQNFVFDHPEKMLEPLVGALLQNVYDPFERVKLIHDWIADNIRYNFEGFISGNLGDNTWTGVLKAKRSVCEGYANLFEQMCVIAGIKSLKVTGFAKGYGYNPLKATPGATNHAWNVITIMDNRYLVDVTWDSGYINYFGQSVKDYSTEYLFADPSRFINSHLPEKPEDQLLTKSLTYEEFNGLPNFHGAFFDYGISSLDPALGSVIDSQGALTLHFQCPDDIFLDAEIYDQKNKQIDSACFVTKEGNIATLHVAFPSSDTYALTLFASPRKLNGSRFFGVMEVLVRNKGTSENKTLFPALFTGYWVTGCELVEPLQGQLEKGKEYQFVFRSNGTKKIMIDNHGIILEFHTDDGKTYSLTFTIPDIPSLDIFALDNNGKWTGLLRYIVSK
jgi:hypothetical protein